MVRSAHAENVGNVLKSGSPAQNQLTTWASGMAIQGQADCLYDGSVFRFDPGGASEITMAHAVGNLTFNMPTTGDQFAVQIAGTPTVEIEDSAINIHGNLMISNDVISDGSYMALVNNGATAAYVSLEEPNGDSTWTITTPSLTTSYTLALPDGVGTNGQVLATDGNNPAQLSWEDAGTGTFDGLSDTNLTSVGVGDVMYWDGTDWVNLPAVATGSALVSGGVEAAPTWDADVFQVFDNAPTTGDYFKVKSMTPDVFEFGTLNIVDDLTPTLGGPLNCSGKTVTWDTQITTSAVESVGIVHDVDTADSYFFNINGVTKMRIDGAATALNIASGWTYTVNGTDIVNTKTAISTADFDKTSDTSFADVTGLSIALAANTRYYVKLSASIDFHTTPEFKIIWANSGGGTWLMDWNPSMGSFANVLTFTDSYISSGGPTSSNARLYEFSGFLLTDGSAGNLTIQFAQNTSDVNTCTVKAGSMLQTTSANV